MIATAFLLNGRPVGDEVSIQRFAGGPPDHLTILNLGDRTLRQLMIQDMAGRLKFSNVREASGGYVCALGSPAPGGRVTCWVRTPAHISAGVADIRVYEKDSPP